MLRAEVRKLIEKVTELLEIRYGHQRVVELLAKENKRIREDNQRLMLQNNKLFDRLMARNFESYAVYREDTEEIPGNSYIGSHDEPILDESNIGEVIEDETIR